MNSTVGLFKRHRKLVWLFLFVALVSICLTIWSHDSEPRAPKVPKPIAATTSFQAYSNSPSGQRWALLTVTNRDFGTLYFAAGLFLVELSNQPAFPLDADWQRPSSLPPHSTATVAAEIPSGLGPWRARCTVVRVTWRDRVPNVFPRWWPDFLNPVSGTYYAQGSLLSDWVRDSSSNTNVQATDLSATNLFSRTDIFTTNNPPASIFARPQGVQNGRLDSLQLMKDFLDLTDEQAKKLEPVLQEQKAQISAFRRETSLSRPERMAKLKELQTAMDAKIKAVLTPEQFEKWRQRGLNLQPALKPPP